MIQYFFVNNDYDSGFVSIYGYLVDKNSEFETINIELNEENSSYTVESNKKLIVFDVSYHGFEYWNVEFENGQNWNYPNSDFIKKS